MRRIEKEAAAIRLSSAPQRMTTQTFICPLANSIWQQNSKPMQCARRFSSFAYCKAIRSISIIKLFETIDDSLFPSECGSPDAQPFIAYKHYDDAQEGHVDVQHIHAQAAVGRFLDHEIA